MKLAQEKLTTTPIHKYYQTIRPILETPKNRLYTATILSFLTVSLFGWYAIRPTITTILSLRREIQDKTKINQQMDEKIAALIDAQTLYENISDQLPYLMSAIPQRVHIDEVMQSIDTLRFTHNLSVTSIETSKVPLAQDSRLLSKVDSFYQTTIKIIFTGPYPSVLAMINDLTRLSRIVTLEDVTLDRNEGDELTPTTVTANITATVYSLPPPTQTPLVVEEGET